MLAVFWYGPLTKSKDFAMLNPSCGLVRISKDDTTLSSMTPDQKNDIFLKLCSAIEGQRVVGLLLPHHSMRMEPYALGRGHDGNLTLSGYIIEGEPIIKGNCWIYCPLDNIKEIIFLDTFFIEPRFGYTSNDARFSKFILRL